MGGDDYRQWYLPEGAKMRLGKGSISDIAYSPNGKHFMVAGSMGIWVYDAHTYKHIALLTEDSEDVSRIAFNKITFSEDGSTFATTSPKYGGSSYVRIRIWNAYTGRIKAYIKEGSDARSSLISTFVLSPNGKMLITRHYDDKTRLWNTRTGEHIATFTKQHYAFSISPDGKTLASVSDNGTSIQLWDAETIRQTKTIPTRNIKKVNWLAFFSDAVLVTGNLYETVQFLNIKTLEHTEISLTGIIKRNYSTVSITAKMWAIGTMNGIVQLWDLQTGQSKVLPTNISSRISSLAFSPNSLKLACVGIDGTISFFDVNTQQQIANITGHSGQRKSSLVFSQDGKLLAGCGQLWNLKTGLPQRALTANSVDLSYNAFDTFSPNGKIYGEYE